MNQGINTHLPIGTMLQHYKITKVLGKGGFGVTYLAENTRLKQLVAIKEYFPTEMGVRAQDSISLKPHSEKVDDYQYGLQSFLSEAQVLAQFKHPNIVRVSDYLELNGTAYMIMDFEKGEDLEKYLKRTNFKGNMPETELKSYMLPILKGLQAVHDKELLHRDIKPGNIYLRKDTEPMLIDFGAARYALGEHSKSMSAIISMGYAPPEQYSTSGKQTQASDLYAWGATAYKLITGKTPIESPDRAHALAEQEPDPYRPLAKHFKGKYSDDLLTTIDQCLKIPSKKRPQSANQVIAMLTGEKAPINKTEKVKPEDRFKNTKPSHSETGTKYVKDDERFANTKSNNHSPVIARERSDRGNLLKYAMILLILTGIGTGSYYGYNYYQTQQQKAEQLAEQARIAQQNETTAWTQAQNLDTIQGYQLYLDNWQNGSHAQQAQSKINRLKEQARLAQLNAQEKQAEQTKQAQRLLVKLGYKNAQNGDLDTRTIEGIKAFEKSQKLVVTGDVDNVLLQELKKTYTRKDKKTWVDAQGDISKLQSYSNKFTDGQYINQVKNKIQKIKQELASKAERKRLAIIEEEKKQQVKQAILKEQKAWAKVVKEKNKIIKTKIGKYIEFPFDESSECYEAVSIDSTFKEFEDIKLISEATEKISITPPEIEWVQNDEKNLPDIRIAIVHPVDNYTEIEQFKTKDSWSQVKIGKFNCTPDKIMSNDTSNCPIKVPEEFKTISKKLVKKRSWVEIKQIKPKYKTVKVKTLSKDSSNLLWIPTVFGERVKKDAMVTRSEVPAEYKTFYYSKEITKSKIIIKPIKCEAL